MSATASDISNYLAQGYSQLAKVAGKAPVSQLYKKRSTAAASGQAIEPLQPDTKHLDALTVNEAGIYRDQLIEGLQAGGRERQPLLAAIAQVNYDCWVMPLPNRKGAPRSAECHQRFLQAFEGLPDKHHRGPISSVEPWQLATTLSAPPAALGGDSIGALILSLSAPSPSQRTSAYDTALASVYAVGQQPPDGQMDGQVMGNCDDHCLAMSFSGPATAPLIAALIDDRDRNFRGPGDSSAGQQSANAGTTNGSPGGASGAGNSGSANNGQSNNGQGTNTSGGSVSGDGSGSGSPGSASPGSGGPGSGGPGSGGPGSGDGGDGPGNSGGHGRGHHHG